MTEKTFDVEDLAITIAITVLSETVTTKETLIAKIMACIQKRVDQKLVPKNYNQYVSKKKREKWTLALKQNDCEKKFWSDAVKKLDAENIQHYYDELDRILTEQGLKQPPKIKKGTYITCYYCERIMDAAQFGGEFGIHCTKDHVIPRSKFGANNNSNLVNACNECNWLKSDLSIKNFIRRLEEMYSFKTPFMGIPIDLYLVIRKNALKLLNSSQKIKSHNT